jgi:hypothetical protein
MINGRWKIFINVIILEKGGQAVRINLNMNLLNSFYGLFSFDMGIDLGTPYRAYLFPRSTSSRHKGAGTGRAGFRV